MTLAEVEDPVELARAALECVPADPARAAAGDYELISAALDGLSATAAAVRARQTALRLELELDATWSPRLRADVEWQRAIRERCDLAYDQLTTYLRAALAAFGLTIETIEEED